MSIDPLKARESLESSLSISLESSGDDDKLSSERSRKIQNLKNAMKNTTNLNKGITNNTICSGIPKLRSAAKFDSMDIATTKSRFTTSADANSSNNAAVDIGADNSKSWSSGALTDTKDILNSPKSNTGRNETECQGFSDYSIYLPSGTSSIPKNTFVLPSNEIKTSSIAGQKGFSSSSISISNNSNINNDDNKNDNNNYYAMLQLDISALINNSFLSDFGAFHISPASNKHNDITDDSVRLRSLNDHNSSYSRNLKNLHIDTNSSTETLTNKSDIACCCCAENVSEINSLHPRLVDQDVTDTDNNIYHETQSSLIDNNQTTNHLAVPDLLSPNSNFSNSTCATPINSPRSCLDVNIFSFNDNYKNSCLKTNFNDKINESFSSNLSHISFDTSEQHQSSFEVPLCSFKLGDTDPAFCSSDYDDCIDLDELLQADKKKQRQTQTLKQKSKSLKKRKNKTKKQSGELHVIMKGRETGEQEK